MPADRAIEYDGLPTPAPTGGQPRCPGRRQRPPGRHLGRLLACLQTWWQTAPSQMFLDPFPPFLQFHSLLPPPSFHSVGVRCLLGMTPHPALRSIHSIHSIPFHSIPFHSIPFHFPSILQSIPFHPFHYTHHPHPSPSPAPAARLAFLAPPAHSRADLHLAVCATRPAACANSRSALLAETRRWTDGLPWAGYAWPDRATANHHGRRHPPGPAPPTTQALSTLLDTPQLQHLQMPQAACPYAGRAGRDGKKPPCTPAPAAARAWAQLLSSACPSEAPHRAPRTIAHQRASCWTSSGSMSTTPTQRRRRCCNLRPAKCCLGEGNKSPAAMPTTVSSPCFATASAQPPVRYRAGAMADRARNLPAPGHTAATDLAVANLWPCIAWLATWQTGQVSRCPCPAKPPWPGL